jgi:hypothetical protein
MGRKEEREKDDKRGGGLLWGDPFRRSYRPQGVARRPAVPRRVAMIVCFVAQQPIRPILATQLVNIMHTRHSPRWN